MNWIDKLIIFSTSAVGIILFYGWMAEYAN